VFAVVTQLRQYPEEILEFMRTIANYEHFPQLNFPTPLKIDSANMSKIGEVMMRKHFLASLVLRFTSPEVMPDKTHRMKALNILHLLLYKHDHDPRLKHEKARRRLIQIYFPFILQVSIPSFLRFAFTFYSHKCQR